MTHRPIRCTGAEMVPDMAPSRSLSGRRPVPAALLVLAALSAPVALGGCQSHDGPDRIVTGSIASNWSEAHPITVGPKTQSMDLPVLPMASGLTDAQRSVVNGFFERYDVRRDGEVQLFLPAGSANSAASERVAAQMVDLLLERGIPEARISAFDYDAASLAETPIRIAYRHIAAQVEPCGDWSTSMLDNGENGNYANFGCAIQNNIAAQIADPSDLIGPRALGDIDVARRSTVIEEYRSSGMSASSE